MDQDKDKEANASRKRDLRASARKVTSLTAEQLERKRANDRDAQRSIRQRTKEHIESLELRVMGMESKAEQYDDVVRRNAALEEEIGRLKHQLAVVTGNERSGIASSEGILPSRFFESFCHRGEVGTAATAATATGSLHRAASTLPSSNPMNQALHDWQHYRPTQSTPMHQPSKDYPISAGQYKLQGQLQPPQLTHQTLAPMPLASHHHAGYNAATAAADSTGSYPVHSTDPSMQTWLQYYQTPSPLNASRRREEGFHRDIPQSYESAAHRSMSASTISSENELRPERVPVHRYQQHLQVHGYHHHDDHHQQQPYDPTKQPEESHSHEFAYEWNLPN